MADPELDAICRRLDSIGWSKWNVSRLDKFDHVWYRKFQWEPKCQDNQDKQFFVQLQLWDNRKYSGGRISFCVAIYGRPSGPDIGHITFQSSARDIDSIEPNVDRVLKAWRAIQEGAA